MRFHRFFLLFVMFMMSLLLIHGRRKANLAIRRKLHRHNGLQRRRIPLHSRVPFP
ncbi:apelin receptor early endogenous ligand [Capricornis sumatraensis]|uniref:apelin receptor early endogenous ligand-like n=1 Tax=Capricornis sumatraensis TaxID=34865 RepID=UPI00360446C8